MSTAVPRSAPFAEHAAAIGQWQANGRYWMPCRCGYSVRELNEENARDLISQHVLSWEEAAARRAALPLAVNRLATAVEALIERLAQP